MKGLTPRSLANAGALLMVTLLGIVYRFPPATTAFYPLCPISAWLGVECPGCGSTRSLHALLHLRLEEALFWNPMFPALFVLALAWGAMQYVAAVRQGRFVTLRAPATAYWLAGTAMVVLSLARNFV